MATGFGVGRLVLSGALLAAPTGSVRLLGVDSASAKRMAFLAGWPRCVTWVSASSTLASRNTPAAAVAGGRAVADGVDALAIAAATKQGVTRGPVGVAAVVTAAAAAVLGARPRSNSGAASASGQFVAQ